MMITITEDTYTQKELKRCLEKYTNRCINSRTFLRWRTALGMYPDENLLYYHEDLKMLIELVAWRDRGGQIKTFVEMKIKEFVKNAD